MNQFIKPAIRHNSRQSYKRIALLAGLAICTANPLAQSTPLSAEQPASQETIPTTTRSNPDPVGLVARIHFNTQTSNFSRARAFYRLLGFTEGRGNFPKTNTHLMARSLGMYNLCTYEIEDIEVINIPNSVGPTAIDLIQFKVPYNDAPPYQQTNHLGMAYAALGSSNFDRDYAYLKASGVPLLSAPTIDAEGKFVFFTDPDGVFYKMVEHRGEVPAQVRTTNIISMPYIAINVSDLDAALTYYQRLGYTRVKPISSRGTPMQAAAYGLDSPGGFKVRGADVSLPGGDQHTLRLTQWLDPYLDEAPYPAPISHIGIHRIALAVTDLDRAVDYLRNAGVEFLSDIAPCCSGTGMDTRGIINAIDPDGTFVELVGAITPKPNPPPPTDCQ